MTIVIVWSSQIQSPITPDTTILFSNDFSGSSSRYDYTDEGAEIKQNDGE
jgi:hypothetical protein